MDDLSEPLGDKSSALLLGMFQDFYRQDVAAEEDVHRTLPFFATALGLIVAALNYVAGQLPPLSPVVKACWPQPSTAPLANACAWPAIAAALLLAAEAVLAVCVLWQLAAATRKRRYQRVGPETSQLRRAQDLQAYHVSMGLEADALDVAVAADLKQRLLADFAKVTAANRRVTQERYAGRARAVSFLLWSLLFGILATMFVVASAKLDLLPKAAP